MKKSDKNTVIFARALSPKEKERFMKLVEEGKTNKEILKANFRGIAKIGHIKRIKQVLYPDGLPPRKSKAEREKDEVVAQLTKIKKVMKRARRVRNSRIAQIIGQNKNYSRGILEKAVELGFLVKVQDEDADENKFSWFFSNESAYYRPHELQKLIPVAEKDRIVSLVRTHNDGAAVRLEDLSFILYGRRNRNGDYPFLETFLEFYVSKGLIVGSSDNQYRVTQRGHEFGLDEQSIRSLETAEIENRLALRQETAKSPINSREDIVRALAKDRINKTVESIDISELMPSTGARFRFLAEILYGNSNTDEELIDWIFEQGKQFDVKPDFSIATGLIQGTFTGKRLDKSRILAEEGKLHTIDAQFASAGILLRDLENVTKKRVFVVQGDDDWDSAESYAWLLMLSENKSWSYGVNRYSLSGELQRRLNYIDYKKKWRMQWEFIQAYQYRIKRAVLNRKEVSEKIDVYKTEYRLIVEILLAVKHGFSYPAIYEQVVDIHALLDVARSFINQRLAKKSRFLKDLLVRLHDEDEKRERDGRKNTYVTPDSLILKNGKNELIQLIHNSNFSSITQYIDPTWTLEKVMRHFGVRGKKIPKFVFDAHQEFFYMTHFHGHWIGCLAGMQNTELEGMHRKKVFNSFVLSSKSHRQVTFRKIPTTPMGFDMEILPDGRIRYYFYTNAIKRVIEDQRSQKHERRVMLLMTDTQHGSITMQPEAEMKFADYGLYGRKEGLADCFYWNGDVIQGVLYPGFFAENRPYRLVSVDSQQRFTLKIMMPLITQAPALRDFAAWMGNHEWNTWSNAITGENALHFLEAYLQGYMGGYKDGKGASGKLERAMTVNRIRLENVEKNELNPRGGNVINHPYFAGWFAGFKVGMTHMWLPHGGGRTPIDQPRRWLHNMADAASDLHVLIGGDKHSFYMASEYDKLLIQLASSASQSGYELARGLFSTVMYTIAVFDNREGIMLEIVPWQFLMDEYECKSPFLKGKDKELERPDVWAKVPYKKLAYKQGKMSPFIESIIDDLTLYLTV